MSEPIFRIPLSEVEKHKAELAAARAIVAAVDVAVCEVANTEAGIPLRQSIVYVDHDPANPIDAVATIKRFMALVLSLVERRNDLECEVVELRNAATEAREALRRERSAGTDKASTPAADDTRSFVATRRDAHGRRFWDGAGWTADVVAARDGAPLDLATLTKLKPRGSRLVALDDVPALLAEDAAKAGGAP